MLPNGLVQQRRIALLRTFQLSNYVAHKSAPHLVRCARAASAARTQKLRDFCDLTHTICCAPHSSHVAPTQVRMQDCETLLCNILCMLLKHSDLCGFEKLRTGSLYTLHARYSS